MPLLKNNLINTKNIICDSKSGITGAGRGLSLKTHFAEANENFAAYGIGVTDIHLKLNKHYHIWQMKM